MNQQKITCPKCGHEIELTEALTEELEKHVREEQRKFALKTAIALSIVVIFGMFGGGAAHAQTDPSGLWADVAASSISGRLQTDPLPVQFRSLRLNQRALLDLLAQAPRQRTPGAATANVILYLPLPDGAYGRFRIVESAVMAPELAAKFPQIKTYTGQGLDDPTATVHLDWTPQGFHAMILSASETVYIDPFSRGDVIHYLSYFKRNARRSSALPFNNPDFIDDQGSGKRIAELVAQRVAAPSGSELRTYRTAVAATGEYTAFHSAGAPTVAEGLAAIVTAMNRVNGVYERDVAIRMQLVADNNLIVYTDAGTDPYSNFDGFTMLDENQSNLDAVIESADYDIGHVFSTGGGGVAFLGVPCVNGFKARGVTGLSNPTGDPFYIDFVAHEIGHQWGGNHTFNGSSGNCSGGNRNASTAYEPGSGTTIQAYAGICSPQNIQSNSDDHFHTLSYDQIIAYSTLGDGNSCPTITNTGNDPPVSNAGTGGFTIPINTPFSLTGSATDPNGDPVTYNWEEFDLGPAGHPNSPVNDAPIFRSFPSQTVPERIFPQISDIVNNTQTLGEILPSYTRSLTFRLTVRDNRVGGGGVDHDQIAFNVTDQAGPFLVTLPNTAVTWNGNTQETVTWNVAGTNAGPVNAGTVNILLSTDGGFTYPTTLASGVANDGSQAITVPNISTTTARVKVEAAANIFFDISNTDFTMVPGEATPLVFRVERTTGDVFTDGAFMPGGADLAERINVSEPVESGDVVELDPSRPKYYRKARGSGKLLAGVITSDPGFVLGYQSSIISGHLSKSEIERPMLALMGKVPVKATTANGQIRPGDLLTVSSKPGFAMRCNDAEKCEGAVLGKALEGLERGEGLVMILVMAR